MKRREAIEPFTVYAFAVSANLSKERCEKAVAGQKPVGEGGKGAPTWTLAQFVHGLLDKKSSRKLSDERLRSETARADLLEAELAKVRKDVVIVDGVLAAWNRVGMAIRRQILTSNLTKPEQDVILRQLNELKPDDFIKEPDEEHDDASHLEPAASPSPPAQ